MTQTLNVPPDQEAKVCRNCGACVALNFCGVCGQRFETQPYSLWHAVGDALEGVTHLDSRLWRTLKTLLLQPGKLTAQFLAGRRTEYLDPFRLYLGISIVFFLVVAFGGPHAVQATPAPDAGSAAQNICVEPVSHVPGPGWLRQPFLTACESSMADHGRHLYRDFIHNLGRAMFVFVPVLAAWMSAMYRRPRSTYTTHLILLVHNQACVFLLMTVALLVHRSGMANLAVVVLASFMWLYLVSYFFRSMRRVYAQSAVRTLVKLTALGAVYALCAACMVFLTGLYSAETA